MIYKNSGSYGKKQEFSPKAIPIEISDPGVEVIEIRLAPGCLEQLKDTWSRFFLAISGSARWQCGGRRYMIGPEILCHVPAGLAIEQEILQNENMLAYALRYEPEIISPELAEQYSSLGLVQFDLGTATASQTRALQSIFREMFFEQDSHQEGWEMVLRSRLIDVAVRMLRLTSRRGGKALTAFDRGSDSMDRVARYVVRLKTSFFRQEMMADAARSVGLSCRQFSELFRKITGQSWRQHVFDLRLKHVASLLTQTDRPVTAVAFESGFDDLSNFHHAFKVTYGCSPLAYRSLHRVRLPSKSASFAEAARVNEPTLGFQLRGMKGWGWTPEQYLKEIPVLASLKMNFLMNCYRSMSVAGGEEPWCNEWWRPIPAERKQKFSLIIRRCAEHGISFCLAMHPQLASPRPLVHGRAADFEAFFQHYAWAQTKGVKWFAVCLDDTSWEPDGPAACGTRHSALLNQIFERLFANDNGAKMAFCPAAFWGDGSNPEHAAYLAAVARDLHPDVFVFWNGDAIVTPRITRVAAQSYKNVVKHRLILWDNYPENDGQPTMHLGPLSGRAADLCEVIDGYLSNAMCIQNEINRIPLATSADYANDPRSYKPARSIGQAILRFGKTRPQQMVLKELVEAYPGFIVTGGGAGTNPVRAKFENILLQDRTLQLAKRFILEMNDLAIRFERLFPALFLDGLQTLNHDIGWMQERMTPLKRPAGNNTTAQGGPGRVP
jgi:AraC-like DNA-binding protein